MLGMIRNLIIFILRVKNRKGRTIFSILLCALLISAMVLSAFDPAYALGGRYEEKKIERRSGGMDDDDGPDGLEDPNFPDPEPELQPEPEPVPEPEPEPVPEPEPEPVPEPEPEPQPEPEPEPEPTPDPQPEPDPQPQNPENKDDGGDKPSEGKEPETKPEDSKEEDKTDQDKPKEEDKTKDEEKDKDEDKDKDKEEEKPLEDAKEETKEETLVVKRTISFVKKSDNSEVEISKEVQEVTLTRTVTTITSQEKNAEGKLVNKKEVKTTDWKVTKGEEYTKKNGAKVSFPSPDGWHTEGKSVSEWEINYKDPKDETVKIVYLPDDEEEEEEELKDPFNYITEFYVPDKIGRYAYPLSKRAVITYYFGQYDELHVGYPHGGVDLAISTGTPILAAENGIVTVAHAWLGTVSDGYGNYVDILHPDGNTTRYGHMSEINVKVGQIVVKGQQIGRVGSTGRSTGPHLHFEVITPMGRTDPMPFINGHDWNLAVEIEGVGGSVHIANADGYTTAIHRDYNNKLSYIESLGGTEVAKDAEYHIMNEDPGEAVKFKIYYAPGYKVTGYVKSTGGEKKPIDFTFEDGVYNFETIASYDQQILHVEFVPDRIPVSELVMITEITSDTADAIKASREVLFNEEAWQALVDAASREALSSVNKKASMADRWDSIMGEQLRSELESNRTDGMGIYSLSLWSFDKQSGTMPQGEAEAAPKDTAANEATDVAAEENATEEAAAEDANIADAEKPEEEAAQEATEAEAKTEAEETKESDLRETITGVEQTQEAPSYRDSAIAFFMKGSRSETLRALTDSKIHQRIEKSLGFTISETDKAYVIQNLIWTLVADEFSSNYSLSENRLYGEILSGPLFDYAEALAEEVLGLKHLDVNADHSMDIDTSDVQENKTSLEAAVQSVLLKPQTGEEAYNGIQAETDTGSSDISNGANEGAEQASNDNANKKKSTGEVIISFAYRDNTDIEVITEGDFQEPVEAQEETAETAHAEVAEENAEASGEEGETPATDTIELPEKTEDQDDVDAMNKGLVGSGKYTSPLKLMTASQIKEYISSQAEQGEKEAVEKVITADQAALMLGEPDVEKRKKIMALIENGYIPDTVSIEDLEEILSQLEEDQGEQEVVEEVTVLTASQAALIMDPTLPRKTRSQMLYLVKMGLVPDDVTAAQMDALLIEYRELLEEEAEAIAAARAEEEAFSEGVAEEGEEEYTDWDEGAVDENQIEIVTMTQMQNMMIFQISGKKDAINTELDSFFDREN